MTAYSNFIQDFPIRCDELLDAYFGQAKAADREVTLMLAIATAAFVIPFERLRPPPETHPADDVKKYEKAKKQFDCAINSSFLCSHLWGRGNSWEIIERVNGKYVREEQISTWARGEVRKPLSKKKPANAVLTHLRNALTHGSIFTFPSGNLQIETIIFLSRCYEEREIENSGRKVKEKVLADKYDILLVSPEDFHTFLKSWINFLRSLDLIITVTQHSIFDFSILDLESQQQHVA